MSLDTSRSQIKGREFYHSKAIFCIAIIFSLKSVNAEEVTKLSSSSFGGTLWFSFVSLMLAAGLLLLVAWLIRKNTSTKLPTDNARILFQYPLGPRDRILVIRVLNRVMILGQSATQINYLAELDPEEVADLTIDAPNQTLKNTFAKYIKVNFN